MLASGMTSVPDPSSSGGLPRRRQWPARIQRRRVNPVPYVAGVLLWQGIAWLVLAAAGFSFWIMSLPAGLGPGSATGAILWAGAQLLAIGIGAGMGAAEIGMACRLRGGPRWVLTAAVGQGVTLGANLVVAAVSILVIGSVLELLALIGVLLPPAAVSGPPPGDDSDVAGAGPHHLNARTEMPREHVLFEHVSTWPRCHDLAGGDKQQPVGELAGQRQVVNCRQHGQRAVAPHLVDQLKGLHPAAQIQRARRLVQQQYWRFLSQRPGQYDSLQLAAGHGPQPAAGQCVKV